jgi:ketosteroid isomerase-like protein
VTGAAAEPGAVWEIAEQFFAACDRFDPDSIAELVTEDVTYRMPPHHRADPVVGRAQVARALGGGSAGQVFDVTTVQHTLIKIVADETTAIGLTIVRCATLNGTACCNECAWQLEFAGAKVKSVTEFSSSLRFAQAAGTVP